MNIVFLTADEPLYLPAFFTQVLAERAKDTRAIFLAPPRYGKDSPIQMARKYVRAFGWCNFVSLARRTASAKLRDRLKIGYSRGQYHSIPSAAAAYGVPCERVPKVNDEAFLQRLRDMQTDLIVSASCPQVFRKPLISLPPRGCLNMHGALLPKYRGIAPSFWMMVNGETKAGVTVFFVNEDIDAGDVCRGRGVRHRSPRDAARVHHPQQTHRGGRPAAGDSEDRGWSAGDDAAEQGGR